MAAVLSSLDLGQESIATGGNRPEERAGGGMASVAPGSGMQAIDDVAEGLQGLTTKSDEMAATKVRGLPSHRGRLTSLVSGDT
jgi:hypothetical protein